jgi:integrase/recombinase XerD
MIYTLFFTGIRVTELISIKRGDYTLYHGKAVLKIRAKGGKYRMIPVHLELQTVLEEYLDSLRAKLRELKRSRLKSDDHLFFSLKNNRNKERPNISRYGVYKILNKRAFQAGIRQKISPHSARATLITSLLSQGQDLYRVSLSVGHAQPETTKIYDKRKRAVHDNAILDLEY